MEAVWSQGGPCAFVCMCVWMGASSKWLPMGYVSVPSWPRAFLYWGCKCVARNTCTPPWLLRIIEASCRVPWVQYTMFQSSRLRSYLSRVLQLLHGHDCVCKSARHEGTQQKNRLISTIWLAYCHYISVFIEGSMLRDCAPSSETFISRLSMSHAPELIRIGPGYEVVCR